ncbi:helix-turn-helix domain-containing protein [Streptomyces sp. H27-D2]|uniref:helix-turn-helix domain-containing protein n=1 Tax=Streptomyces sp. H27-D2 TaxID=3046304 RepID=UPI002DBE847E|nr:helix-turn-helix transcriptional regulator [Streptomyces sp. H27-D2]MEC4020402.1 helix-turn-helix transcriptional regulator [Streptomyces sp. H27-D2]
MVLGTRLKDLREKARVPLRTAAQDIDVAELTVRRMEKAEVGLKIPYVRALLQLYAVPAAEIDVFLGLAKQANVPGWWNPWRDVLPGWFSAYVSLESAARLIRSYEPHYVPGLLQTGDYARALFVNGLPNASDEDRERRVALRVKRQELLAGPDAPAVWAVLDETVLRRPVGGAAVMRAQIDRLLAATHLSNITLQIMPFAAGPHVGAFGPFHYFRFEMPERPDIVYTEGLTGAAYLEDRLDVVSYLEALNRMTAQAASVDASRTILEETRKEYS